MEAPSDEIYGKSNARNNVDRVQSVAYNAVANNTGLSSFGLAAVTSQICEIP